MTRKLDPLPSGQVLVDFTPGGIDFCLHDFDLGIEVNIVTIRVLADLFQPSLQLQNRFFEIQWMKGHVLATLNR